MKRIVVTGASSGIGAAIVARLVSLGHEVIGVSRRQPAAGTWLSADLSRVEEISRISNELRSVPINALIHNAGIWESDAFSNDYEFETSSPEEIRTILNVNLLAPILLTQGLIDPLAAEQGRVILIGSTSGLDNIGLPEVAYNASKAGLRGAAQAMSVALVRRRIAVTLINPGDVDTEPGGRPPRLSLADLVESVVHCLALSPQTVISEMTLRPRPM